MMVRQNLKSLHPECRFGQYLCKQTYLKTIDVNIINEKAFQEKTNLIFCHNKSINENKSGVKFTSTAAQ